MWQIKAICSTQNISTFPVNFKYKDFELIYDADKLYSDYVDETFINKIGTINLKHLTDRPFFAATFEKEEKPDLRAPSEGMFYELTNLMNDLWFAKDCCANVSALYLYVPQNKATIVRTKITNPCTSMGEYNYCELTESDFNLAQQVSIKLKKENIKAVEKEQFDADKALVGKIMLPAFHYLNYNIHKRLDKCVMFLTMARNEPFLPLKIALYMSVFECLFTSDSSEMIHKVSERTALYLNTDKDEMFKVFKQVKLAYDYRSKFIHGQDLKSKKDSNEHLKEISFGVDVLLRRILNQAILVDFDLLNSMDGSKIDEYFNQKIFERNTDVLVEETPKD